jgi:hemolysin III
MLVVGPLLGLEAKGATAEVCIVVYALTITAMLSVSALFHRVMWEPAARRRMRRLDHSMIFCAIAGTYTAISLALPGSDGPILLGFIWAGVVGGIILRLAWLDAPKWAVALPYIVLGWAAVAVLPELLHSTGGLGLGLLMGGGLLYTAGAVVYARKGPDPWPKTFGYHEIFHACVLAAVAAHMCLIAFIVVPGRT